MLLRVVHIFKMAKPILGYWNSRGLAEPIRYLLHYKKVDFEDKRYTPDGLGCEEWQKEKFNLGLDFPNLPYYIEDDIKLTQSITIMRYLGYKHGLTFNTNEQQLRTIVAEQQSVELRRKLKYFIECDEYEATPKEEFLKSVQPLFQEWDKFIGERKFMAGEDITFVDFLVFEELDLYRIYNATILDHYPSLRAYFSRMKNLPELQDYINTTAHKYWSICKHKAKCGSVGDPDNHL